MEKARGRNSPQVSAEHSSRMPSTMATVSPSIYRVALSYPPYIMRLLSSRTSSLTSCFIYISHSVIFRDAKTKSDLITIRGFRRLTYRHHRRHLVFHRCPTKLPLSLLEVTNEFVLMQLLLYATFMRKIILSWILGGRCI